MADDLTNSNTRGEPALADLGWLARHARTGKIPAGEVSG